MLGGIFAKRLHNKHFRFMNYTMLRTHLWCLGLLFFGSPVFSQNFDFNFNNNGQRVCLLTTQVDLNAPSATIFLLDSAQNTSKTSTIFRRALNAGPNDWVQVATNIPAGTGSWTDTDVQLGDVWEYMVQRPNSWDYNGISYAATGFTAAALLYDRSLYRGQMVLAVAQNIENALPNKVARLVQDLTADGWWVNKILAPADNDWDGAQAAIDLKQKIKETYDAAPADDRPTHLFLLGHLPVPRSGSTAVMAPDEHNENKGARGSDTYYADLDGAFTDVATYNPGGLATPLAINQPGDLRWDQDFIPSTLELAFGRVDFRDLTDDNTAETTLIARYLDRLHAYRYVENGFFMGNKTAFYFGYDNSNDGSYRSLPNIALPQDVMQNFTGESHPEWVKNNGPFMWYMQNLSVPDYNAWVQNGMEATVFSSDQSYWGWADVPQNGSIYSRIRALLVPESKCLMTVWTTMGINQCHQPGTGETMGASFRQVMDYSENYQNLPKPPQGYDTPEWWNRTHFAIQGDPTLRLHQVFPPSSLVANAVGGTVSLSWQPSPDQRLVGYHVYQSNAQLGKYERITSQPLQALAFDWNSHQPGNWYMVRAIIHQETGSGVFINPSQGITAQGVTGTDEALPTRVHVVPNPTRDRFFIHSNSPWERATLYNALGQEVANFAPDSTWTTAQFAPGNYILRIRLADGGTVVKLLGVQRP
jgi:hypothetical protein